MLELVHPDDLALAMASMATVVDKEVGDLIPLRVRTSRGTWVYLEIRGTTVIVDGEQLIVLVARDTTRRNLLALDQDDIAVLRAVMSNMHGMVVLVDVDMDESVMLSCFDGDILMQNLQVQPMGDNSVERIGLGAEELTRFEVATDGSGAIAELWIVGQGIPDELFPRQPVLTFP